MSPLGDRAMGESHSLKSDADAKDFVERRRPDAEQLDTLTPGELQVLKPIAEAYASREIAQELVMSIKIVEPHRPNVSTSSE